MARKAEVKSEPIRYTGWCDVNDQESNLKRNQAFFERRFEGFTEEVHEKAMEHANDLIDNLSVATDKRGRTVGTLRDLANDLYSLRAKVTGSSRNLSEEAMAALGALRLEGAGEVTSKAGGVISRRNEIVKASGISRDKVKRAQEVLQEDEKATMRVNEIFAKLERIALHQSRNLFFAKTILHFSLVVSANRRVRHSATSRQRYSAGLLATVLERTIAAKKSRKIPKRIDKEVRIGLGSKLAGVFPAGALEKAENIVARTVDSGTVAGGREKPFMKSAFDIDELLKAALLRNNGSKSAAAEFLRQVAGGFEEQRKEMEQLQSTISELSTETLEEMFQEEFKILLETISSSNEVNQIVKEEVTSYFCDCEKEEGWSNTFGCHLNSPLDDYFEALARIFKFLNQNIDRNELEKSEGPIDLTFLAHGQVKNPLLPCRLFYMNDYVQSITLYEPWGCAIDATAAYGILTGTIRVNNVSYTSEVKPATPSYWNTLPRDYTQIPEVVFTHVDHTETEYRRLQELFRRLQGSTNGFVLRYLSFPGEPAVQEIPLWALCHAVAIVGFTLQKRFRIHVAACLTPADESVLTTEIFRDIRLRTVNCRQYCVVPVVNLPDPVFMRMNLPPPGRPENIPEETFNVLNEFLYTI